MNYEEIKHNWEKVFLVDMKKENNKIFSELSFKWIKKHIKENKKILIIVNKKWHSSWIICQDCWNIPKCNNCDVPVWIHTDKSWNFFGLCHICKNCYSNINYCNNCWSYDINFFGYWIQKIQNEIEKTFKKDSIIIESQTVNSSPKINKILDKIKNHQIIIWTSLVQNFLLEKIDFLIFINADIWLNVPDFNSNYQNFLFLFETIKNLSPKNTIIQTYNPDLYSIRYGAKLDFNWFKNEELKFRKDFGYPPYQEVCMILYKNEIEEKVFNNVSKLYQEILFLKEKFWYEDLEIYSTPPLVYKIFWKYRYNIIIKWNFAENFTKEVYKKLNIQQRWFKIDISPISLV